jgi:hypothetical protein
MECALYCWQSMTPADRCIWAGTVNFVTRKSADDVVQHVSPANLAKLNIGLHRDFVTFLRIERL